MINSLKDALSNFSNMLPVCNCRNKGWTQQPRSFVHHNWDVMNSRRNYRENEIHLIFESTIVSLFFFHNFSYDFFLSHKKQTSWMNIGWNQKPYGLTSTKSAHFVQKLLGLGWGFGRGKGAVCKKDASHPGFCRGMAQRSSKAAMSGHWPPHPGFLQPRAAGTLPPSPPTLATKEGLATASDAPPLVTLLWVLGCFCLVWGGEGSFN